MSGTIAANVFSRMRGLPVIDKATIDWLITQGVPPLALSDPDPLLRADVMFTGRHRFVFPDEVSKTDTAQSVRAVVVPVRDINGDLMDLVAWSNRRGLLGSWLLQVGYLGEAFGPRLHRDGALPVWPHALDWLRAGRDGIVIMDLDVTRIQIGEFGPFIGMGGLDHGRALLRHLSSSPRILVAQDIEKEAA